MLIFTPPCTPPHTLPPRAAHNDSIKAVSGIFASEHHPHAQKDSIQPSAMLENTQDASDTQDKQDVKNSLVPEDEEANLASGATPQLFRQATTSPDAPEW